MIALFEIACLAGPHVVLADIVGPFAIHLAAGVRRDRRWRTGLSVSHVSTGLLVAAGFRTCRQADHFVAEALNLAGWDADDVGNNRELGYAARRLAQRILGHR